MLQGFRFLQASLQYAQAIPNDQAISGDLQGHVVILEFITAWVPRCLMRLRDSVTYCMLCAFIMA